MHEGTDDTHQCAITAHPNHFPARCWCLCGKYFHSETGEWKSFEADLIVKRNARIVLCEICGAEVERLPEFTIVGPNDKMFEHTIKVHGVVKFSILGIEVYIPVKTLEQVKTAALSGEM